MGHIFLLLYMPSNWMSNIVNLVVLGAGYFCMPTNILKLFWGGEGSGDAINLPFILSDLVFKICWAIPEQCST